MCFFSPRAFLEDLAHGPGAVRGSVRRHDSSQHVPGGVRLQERQIRPQAQVRASSSLSLRIVRIIYSYMFTTCLCIKKHR